MLDWFQRLCSIFFFKVKPYPIQPKEHKAETYYRDYRATAGHFLDSVRCYYSKVGNKMPKLNHLCYIHQESLNYL